MERWYRGKPDGKEKIITETGEAMQNDRNRWEQCRSGVHPFFNHAGKPFTGYLRRKAILLEFNESGDLEKA